MSPVLDIIGLCIFFVLFLLFIVFFVIYILDEISKRSQKFILDISAKELALICRSLSDSMNYNAEDRYKEKWDLLLKCKKYQLNLEKNPQDPKH